MLAISPSPMASTKSLQHIISLQPLHPNLETPLRFQCQRRIQKLHIGIIYSFQGEITEQFHHDRLNLQQRQCSSRTRSWAIDKGLDSKRIGHRSSHCVPSIRVEDFHIRSPDGRIVVNHGGDCCDGGSFRDGDACNYNVFAGFPWCGEGRRKESKTFTYDVVKVWDAVDGCSTELWLPLLG